MELNKLFELALEDHKKGYNTTLENLLIYLVGEQKITLKAVLTSIEASYGIPGHVMLSTLQEIF